MTYFAVCIFLSAFLLFQIEPMIGKYILPWFGGSSAVWSSVMLFFQVLLTGGYAYAAWLTRRIQRLKIHLYVVGFSILAMIILGFLWTSPITPGAGLKPLPGANPILEIFKVLAVSVGLPFFLLSSNSPLIQAWFNAVFPKLTAYKLYALSNIGSLLALISYPILIEPNLTLSWQGRIWALGFAAYAGMSAYGALKMLRKGSEVVDTGGPAAAEPTQRPTGRYYVLWIGLAATASILLLAVTSQITQEVASIPFLWILPLVIYLLSFVLTFSGEQWYSRQIFLVLFFGASYLAGQALSHPALLGIWKQIEIYSLVLFLACMVCHGELYRLRPHPSRLTTFYLLVSVGGALGGMIINFVVPYVFKGFWELPLGLTFCWLLFLAVSALTQTKGNKRWVFIADAILIVAMTAFLSLQSYQQIHSDLTTVDKIERNFYGVIRVRENYFSAVIPIRLPAINQTLLSYDKFTLVHGATNHGFQFHDDSLRDLPTSYYGPAGGGGLAILNGPNRGKGMRVGVLGLGIGTMAAYGQPGDVYRFYEINPQVISLAEGAGGYFSYLSESKAKVEIVTGDARLSLENEWAKGQAENYDILVLDVFSSDSIPVHLLDEEAFDLYLKQLQPEGILVVHISNSHLDLTPVVWKLADHFGLARVLIDNPGDGVITYRSKWFLLSRDPAVLANPKIAVAATPMRGYTTKIRLWTDEYNNLFQILH